MGGSPLTHPSVHSLLPFVMVTRFSTLAHNSQDVEGRAPNPHRIVWPKAWVRTQRTPQMRPVRWEAENLAWGNVYGRRFFSFFWEPPGGKLS